MSKVKIATFAVIGLAGLALVVALPVGVLVGAAAFGAYRYTRRTAAALFPLALGVGLALAFWCAGDLINTLKHLGGTKPVVPLDIAGWMTMDRLDPANRAVRVGLILGALGGVVFVLARGRGGELQHDERHVHGLRVAENAAKGTRRWAGDKDISHVVEFGPPRMGDKFGGGIVLGRLKGRIVRAQPSLKGKPPLPGHAMVVAGTGAGKTYSFVIPNTVAAACTGESIVVTDPKGELTCLLAPWLKAQGYDVYVFNLQYPEWGDRWNPVLECRDDEEVTAFATAIVHNAARDTSGFFVMKEIQLLKALVYLLRADFPPEQAHLRSVLSLLAWPVEALDERFQEAYRAGRLPREGLEEWRGAVSSNIDNAISGLTAKLGVIRAEPVAKLLSGTPGDMIDMSALGRKRAALFCVLPIGSGHLRPILATFYYFFFRRLYGLAAENGGKLPNPTRFLLDEFANVGQVPGFTEVISTARSMGIYVQFILQSVRQLADVYGANELEVITGNCPVRLFLGGDDRTTTTYFSQQLGEAAVYSVSESRNVTMPWDRLDVAKRRETVVRRALMEPEELAGMDAMAAVCLMRWCYPLYLQKLGWEELPQAKEIKKLAVSTLADVAPKKDFKLELPEMPELAEEEPPYRPDRRRTRSGGGGGPSIDDLFGGTPDFD